MSEKPDDVTWAEIVTDVAARYPHLITIRRTPHPDRIDACKDTRQIMRLDACKLSIGGVSVEALGSSPDMPVIIAVETRLLELFELPK